MFLLQWSPCCVTVLRSKDLQNRVINFRLAAQMTPGVSFPRFLPPRHRAAAYQPHAAEVHADINDKPTLAKTPASGALPLRRSRHTSTAIRSSRITSHESQFAPSLPHATGINKFEIAFKINVSEFLIYGKLPGNRLCCIPASSAFSLKLIAALSSPEGM